MNQHTNLLLVILVFSAFFFLMGCSGPEYVIEKVNTDDLNISGNLNVGGNVHIDGNLAVKRPYGMFSSMKTQTVPISNTAYYMDFNTTEDSYLIQKIGDTNFMFQQTGDYEIIISVIATSTTANKRVNIWVQKNGVAIARSNTPYDFKSNNAIAVIAVPFILDMNTTDVFSVMYSANDTGVSLPALASQAGGVPQTPSVIMSILKVSEIPSM